MCAGFPISRVFYKEGLIVCNLRRIDLSQQKGRCRTCIEECLPVSCACSHSLVCISQCYILGFFFNVVCAFLPAKRGMRKAGEFCFSTSACTDYTNDKDFFQSIRRPKHRGDWGDNMVAVA